NKDIIIIFPGEINIKFEIGIISANADMIPISGGTYFTAPSLCVPMDILNLPANSILCQSSNDAKITP
ncbi:MAG: hypothetical protein LBQ71_06120, partial [Hungatella sp.]|nr:hypothetical protein [Hungatella sp.]